ncbi:hypothetical protein GUJ93_ZPchr0004g39699 [Zizania palustris]|uniref:Uncharacterized protein n=1 Tax=Zizania palustris TaxID=103762 RepID=A0A8J5VYR4_ZIZPA|nr:hypothetical protein GUJ93_ZPchr0004g39699 [Zizania palustris]
MFRSAARRLVQVAPPCAWGPGRLRDVEGVRWSARLDGEEGERWSARLNGKKVVIGGTRGANHKSKTIG